MENLDLTVLLRNCPEDTKLYSPIFGEVTFKKIVNDKEHPTVVKVGGISAFCGFCRVYLTKDEDRPIVVDDGGFSRVYLTKEGKIYACEDAECMLFPSRDNRDWSTFKVEQTQPQKFEPFQKVLVRNSDNYWRIGFFDFEGGVEHHHYYVIGRDYPFDQCLPYEGNEHLKDTNYKPKKGGIKGDFGTNGGEVALPYNEL